MTRYSQTYTVDLDSIFKESTPRLFSLENEDIAMPESELMKNLMMIIEAYAILGGASFIESCKNELRSIFHSIFKRSKYAHFFPVFFQQISRLTTPLG